MSVLILLSAVILCWWGGVLLVRQVGRSVTNPKWKKPAMVSVALVLIAAPFVDEVIGRHQFEALCKANGIESADISKARGRQVKVEYGERQLIGRTIMPIKESDVIFRDADSKEILIRHKNYYAMGGWLMRLTPLSMGSPQPMTFGGSTCDVRVEQEIFKANSITFLYK